MPFLDISKRNKESEEKCAMIISNKDIFSKKHFRGNWKFPKYFFVGIKKICTQ
jgi:hypothetical protein